MADRYQQGRIEYLLQKLLPVLLSNIKYPLVSMATINFFDWVVKKFELAREWMVHRMADWAQPLLFHLTSQNSGKYLFLLERSREKKVMGNQNLIFSETNPFFLAKVRYTSENLVLDLVPEILGYPTFPPSLTSPTTSPTTAVVAAEPVEKPILDPAEGLPRLTQIVNVLLSLLKTEGIHDQIFHLPRGKNHPDRGYALEDHKGLTVLRLLAWAFAEPLLLETYVDEPMTDLLTTIFSLVKYLDNLKVDCDEHRLQVSYFFLHTLLVPASQPREPRLRNGLPGLPGLHPFFRTLRELQIFVKKSFVSWIFGFFSN
jgi:hypothetical protein